MDDEIGEIREALQTVSLFSDVLTSDQLDALARDCSPFFFLAGSALMRQGDFGASMFCITEGLVSVVFVDARHRRNEIRQLGPGSVVGEIELLTGETRIATVTALTNVRVLEISKQALDAAFARAPDLIEAFGSVLAIRQEMLHQIARDRHVPLKTRIARQIRHVFASKGGAADDLPD